MMKIKEFIDKVALSRKRNGIILFDESNSEWIAGIAEQNVNVIDLANLSDQSIVISADSLITSLTKLAGDHATLFLNVEIFLAPRFLEGTYLSSLLPRFMHLEPLKPVFLGFYSKPLYNRIKNFYINNQSVSSHWCEPED